MDDHLLDEVFSRFDPEGTGKVWSWILQISAFLALRC